MRKICVELPGRGYDICIGEGVLDKCGALIRDVCAWKKALVVTDRNVAALYLERVCTSLESHGFDVKCVVIPPGEKSKSPAMLQRLYGRLAQFKITRGDGIVALGGGVVGDVAGFAAATWLRGVPYVQIPTTLLAQVDSSVGGKVAINLPQGKNLVGAFYQPRRVIADVGCVQTLPPRVLSDGMGEVIKYGAIADAKLFQWSCTQRRNSAGDWAEMVARCCAIKAHVVEQDERDTGLRMTLNFGHTLGHAIEQFYKYRKYTHGEAVGIGMVWACEQGERKGVTRPGTANQMRDALVRHGLPTELDPLGKKKFPEIAKAMALDKKNVGATARMVLLEKIGKCKVVISDPPHFPTDEKI